MRHGLFVYGTLQLPEKLQSLLGRVPSLEPATLHGYRCGLVARADFPGIVPQPDSVVNCQVLAPLTQAELELLDQYEGELYQRLRVTVVADRGPVTVWVYAIAPWAWGRVTDQAWTVEAYRARKQPRWTYRS
ncbi:MAG: gamma-glutamylcyclotransferase family protein [Gammaproteobacteria bacterium]